MKRFDVIPNIILTINKVDGIKLLIHYLIKSKSSPLT